MDSENLKNKVKKINKKMLELANDGEKAALDDSCLILYSMMKDNAYLIKKQLEENK